jgi:hypothetical protein
MMWCRRGAWPGLGCGGSAGRRRGRAAAEQGARQCCGPSFPVHQSEIGRAGKHQWVTGMLFVLWIGDEEQWWRLSTVGSGGGGGPVRD